MFLNQKIENVVESFFFFFCAFLESVLAVAFEIRLQFFDWQINYLQSFF